MNRLVSWVLVITLLVNVLALPFFVRPTQATGTIYVRADGSIDPPTAPISSVDNVTYTLTSNITSDTDGIVIERDNVALDGAGYTLLGTQGWPPYQNGTSIVGSTNVTIQNMYIKNFANGIVLDNSSFCKILGNVMVSNGMGVWLAYSSNSTIEGNCITDHHAAAIYLWPASTDNSILQNNLKDSYFGVMAYDSINVFCGNNITNCWYGIDLAYGSNNTISSNTFSSAGLFVFSCFKNTVEHNIVNGKPLVYLEDVSNYTVEEAGQVILVNCDSIKVGGLNLSDTMYGLELWGTNNSRIAQNAIKANKWGGIFLRSSSNNTFEGNTITGNLYHGVHFYSSSYNTLRNNEVSDNLFNFYVEGSDLSHFIQDADASNTVNGKPVYYWINETEKTVPSDAGYVALVNCTHITIQNLTLTRNAQAIMLAFTTNSTITRNNITTNEYGIYSYESENNDIIGNNITWTWYGVCLRVSSNNTIQENTISWSNYYGILASSASHNSIVRNTLATNWYGIWLESSSNNSIYHNEFIDNTHQLLTRDSINTWDDGYPSGGNYWSDYNGTDFYNGLYQNITGSDGIGDEPYIIAADNSDNFPLRTHNVATTSLELSKAIVGQGYPFSIKVTVENQGYSPEILNVTVFANSSKIVSVQTSLKVGNHTTIDFTWNTTDWSKGNYALSAFADEVAAEVNTTDNLLIGGIAYVEIPGDINADGKVDVKDVYKVALAYGTSLEGSNPPGRTYEPNCDINGDDEVDVKDYYIVCKHYGETAP